MSTKVSITLDEEVLAFVDRVSQDRSQFINQVLFQESKRHALKELGDAYTALENDPEYRSEVALWELTVGDGIDA